MKKQNAAFLYVGIITASLVLSYFLTSCSEEEFNSQQTKEFAIESALNGASYNIKVGLPLAYNSSSEKFATIYVLDGKENFDFVANHCKEISDRFGVTNVVVVSIGYGRDRSIDYTPTKVSSITGGGPEFLDFISGQLIPRIEKDFNVDTTRNSRVILGHSYGGLFGACALAADNKLFGNYILLSPSIWFDNEVTLQLEKESRVKNKDTQQLVFLGIGEAENDGRMQAPFEAFFQTLRDNYSNIKISKNREKNLDHVGSKNPNIIKGLNFYFQNR
jgi:predicted alpha/beta superfamily hydrolase